MCGRYTLSRTQEIRERFFGEDTDGFDEGFNENIDLTPRYNICPQQTITVVTQGEHRRLEMMTWGLIPSWAKEPKSVAINARIEGILSKPSFEKPIRSSRCLVPATGFYEWKRAGGVKTPYYVRRKDGGLFAFAGLYDIWKGGERKTFAIVTTSAGDFMAQIHHRTPVILAREQESFWLQTQPGQTEKLLNSLRTLSPDEMEFYPVSEKVNSTGSDGPELVERSVVVNPQAMLQFNG
jgi:putative SOS response-associated peptidase YedK